MEGRLKLEDDLNFVWKFWANRNTTSIFLVNGRRPNFFVNGTQPNKIGKEDTIIIFVYGRQSQDSFAR